jgi:hypothetical protein
MANVIYNRFLANLQNKVVDLEADTIKCALVTSSYTPDKVHNTWSDVSTYEVSGTGYTANGQDLANKSVTEDDSNDLAYFDSDNPSWASSTITARGAVLYDDTLAGDDLIGYWDFTEDKSSSNGTFTVTVDANGWLKLAQGT